MNFETAADSFIRPRIAPRAVPASAVLESRGGESQVSKSRGSESRGGIDTGEGEVSFDDLLDLVNPLHHLPVIGTLYRKLTGDSIAPPARILGGLLYGGPLGFVASVADAIAEEAGGQSAGDAVFTAMFGRDDDLVAAHAAPRDAPGPNVPPIPDAPAGEAPPADTPLADTPPADTLAGKAALDAFLNDLAGLNDRAGLIRSAEARPDAESPPAPSPPAAAPEEAPGDGRILDRRETAAVPANLIGLGPRDRRGRAVPEPAPPVPPAPAKRTAPRDGNAAVTLRPGQPAAGVDPRFLAPANSPPSTSPPASTDPLPSTSLGDPLAEATAFGQADFSSQMMRALRKYEDMLTARRAQGRP